MLLSLGIVGVCNIFTSRLCLIALSCRNAPLTYYSPKRVFFFFVFFLPDLHLEHARFDTWIVSRAPATAWPASQWCSLYYPHLSLYSSPFRLKSSIITRPISPLIVQTMWVSLLHLIFPLYLLLTKNSLAGPCNYALITAVENITDILFSSVSVSEPAVDVMHFRYMCLEQNVLMGSYLLAWHRLVLPWTLPKLSISSAAPAFKRLPKIHCELIWMCASERL